jgi:four helix bundle protein
MAKDFTDLEIWQKAHELSLLIYRLTAEFPKGELYGMISQLRRAAVSVVANIVEGYERHHFADQINLFVIARGSCGEVQALLMISNDLGYDGGEKLNELIAEYKTLSKRINAYITYKRKQK